MRPGIDEPLIRRYLLGECSESESTALEEGYLSDPVRRRELEEVEADLLDRYVRGRLAEPERARLERQYRASPARLARLAFARALAAVADGESEQGRETVRRFSLRGALPAAAAVVLALATLALLAERTRLQRQLDGLRAEVAAQREGRAVASATPPPEPPSRRSPAASRQQASELFAVVLSPMLRGEGVARSVAWPGATREIELRLLGDLGRYPRFQASVASDEGDTVWSGPARRTRLPEGDAALVRVPASQLQPGDHVVTLQGIGADSAQEDLHHYSFRVAGRGVGVSP